MRKLHPNVKKIYVIIGIILASFWVLLLSGIIRFGWIRFFLLVIFSVLIFLSIFTEPRSSSGEEYENIFSGP